MWVSVSRRKTLSWCYMRSRFSSSYSSRQTSTALVRCNTLMKWTYSPLSRILSKSIASASHNTVPRRTHSSFITALWLPGWHLLRGRSVTSNHVYSSTLVWYSVKRSATNNDRSTGTSRHTVAYQRTVGTVTNRRVEAEIKSCLSCTTKLLTIIPSLNDAIL